MSRHPLREPRPARRDLSNFMSLDQLDQLRNAPKTNPLKGKK